MFFDDPRKPDVARAALLRKFGAVSAAKWLQLAGAFDEKRRLRKGGDPRADDAIAVMARECRTLAASEAALAQTRT